MKIKNKIGSILLIFLICITTGALFSSYIYYIQNTKSEENRTMQANINRTKYVLKNEINSLDLVTSNFSSLNNIISFIDNTENFDNFFKDSNIDMLIILNKDKQIKYIKLYNIEKESIGIPIELLSYINGNKNTFFNYRTNATVLSLKKNPMLLCSKFIINSDPFNNSSLNDGIVIMGKYIDKDIIKKIEDITDSSLSIFNIEQYELNDIKQDITSQIISNNNIITTDKNTIYGKFVINGINNKPLFMISLSNERNIYLRGLNSLKLFIILFIAIIILLFFICMKTLKKHIIIPIETICSEINQIELTTNNNKRLSIFENDEISNLALRINSMLDKIDKDNLKIQDTAKQLTLILQGAEVGYFDYNIKNSSIYINDKFSRILGQTDDILICSDNIINYIYKEDKEKFINFMRKCSLGIQSNNDSNINVIEIRVNTNDPTNDPINILNNDSNNYKWVLIQCKIIEYNNNLPTRVTGIITNITKRKNIDEELHHLAYHDALTGLYNRGYYEYILNTLDTNFLSPFSVIIGDVNGLKILNDTIGHDAGDELLKTTAQILQSSLNGNGICARYGGDEFAIIVENATDEELENICTRIKRKCIKTKLHDVPLNIALGYSTKNNSSQELKQILTEAEERMYRNKLLDAQSSRNNIITSLCKALSEKSSETNEHAERMKTLCSKIAKKLNLSSAETDRLTLLAVMHDIGKVSISDSILNKPGKLTTEEFNIIKTHSEIGYRICAATPELISIAHEVLYHHERFNGSGGYPKGLKGEQIPLLARIISIIDAYDVMTHDRVYQKAKSKVDAIKEIRNCAGSQFDPELVNICIEVFTENE